MRTRETARKEYAREDEGQQQGRKTSVRTRAKLGRNTSVRTMATASRDNYNKEDYYNSSKRHQLQQQTKTTNAAMQEINDGGNNCKQQQTTANDSAHQITNSINVNRNGKRTRDLNKELTRWDVVEAG